jgi:hypothetical protein
MGRLIPWIAGAIASTFWLGAAAAPAQAPAGKAPVAKRPARNVQQTAPGGQETVPSGPQPGETVMLNEGWYRVEPRGIPQEGFVGALEVGPAALPPPQVRQEAPLRQPAEESSQPGWESQRGWEAQAPRCRQEQARYLQELFRIAGIWYYPEALDLVEALGAIPGVETGTPWLRFNFFGLASAGAWTGSAVGVDPIRPLGWDEGLRWAAKDLVACWTRGR